MSFSDLKRSNKSVFAKLSDELEKSKQGGQTNGKDDRLWKPELDPSGNGYAIIRFLPAPEGEDLPWAKIWSHAFQGPGGWYIENSLTTLNQKDPVSDHNRDLWNSGSDKDKETVRKQKRKLSYYSNILVIQDPKNPDNEGKVFLFKYGKKIFDKIQEAMQPAFQDETPVNPFDFWEGADFKLKIRKVDGYWNYDKSEFATPTPVLGGDDTKLEALWKTEYPLAEITAADKFKSYEQLQNRLALVLGGRKNKVTAVIDEEVETEESNTVVEEPKSAFRESFAPASATTKSADVDDDESLSYFQRLAEA